MRPISALTFIALVTSSAIAQTPPPVKGTLCFVAPREAPKCQAVEGEHIAIPPAEVERHAVWSTNDGKLAVLQTVPAKSESIDVRDQALRTVTLSVRGDRARGWPADLRIIASDENKNAWSWVVPAKSAEALSQICLSPGKFAIGFSADHHVRTGRRIADKGGVSLGQIDLRPMPLLFGRVLTMKDAPIANAQIVRVDRKTIATTDEQGNFRAEAGEPLPDSVFVERAGFGSLLVPLHLATGDADLGTLRLGSGIKLTLRILRPEGNRDALRVSLKRETEQKYEVTPVSSKDLAADDESLAFTDLTKGKYWAIVEGKAAFEKLATQIDVGESDAQKEIRIEPYRLDGSARIGDDPINGEVNVSMSRLRMEMLLPIVDGRFTATLWQHGSLVGFVKAKELGAPEVAHSPELGADPSTWNIQFPKRFITGRIFDAETQQPISGAHMDLLKTAGSNRLYSAVHLQDDGSYSIMSTQAGTYELKVGAPDHVEMKQTVEVREDDASAQRDFALTHGIPTTLEVRWPSGAPVANAPVMEGVASDGHNAERHYILDATGHLALRLQRGESRTLYIVPSEGSFAVAHVTASDQNDANVVRVVVPDPAGSLKISISTADGKPVRAGVGMRYNGETIVAPVLTQIGFRGTPAMMNDRMLLQLPAGAYELWPVSPSSYAPIGSSKSVSLSTGEATVDLVANQ